MSLICWLMIKHFVIDFPLQNEYMYKNKHIYGHFGGLDHAMLHTIGTILVLAVFAPEYTLLGLVDGILHYHIDWLKSNINKELDLTPTNSNWFWTILGLDQFLHFFTYAGIVYFSGLWV